MSGHDQRHASSDARFWMQRQLFQQRLLALLIQRDHGQAATPCRGKSNEGDVDDPVFRNLRNLRNVCLLWCWKLKTILIDFQSGDVPRLETQLASKKASNFVDRNQQPVAKPMANPPTPPLPMGKAHGAPPRVSPIERLLWPAPRCQNQWFPNGFPLASPSPFCHFQADGFHNAMSPQNLCNRCQSSWTHNFGAALRW